MHSFVGSSHAPLCLAKSFSSMSQAQKQGFEGLNKINWYRQVVTAGDRVGIFSLQASYLSRSVQMTNDQSNQLVGLSFDWRTRTLP